MTWTAFQWVWRLEAPLFVGMPPAGALNRCRPYVPARTLWGAVTAEISRSESGENFPGYREFGEKIERNCRFTYLFPAEKRGDAFLAWVPKFERTKGLQWCCHGGEGRLSDRDFRRRLLDSRPGTAIAPRTDSAAEGTLRETDCINRWWRDSECRRETRAMFLLGYVFLKNSDLRGRLCNVDTLFVGGDTRYGLGKICCVRRRELAGDVTVFEKKVRLDGKDPQIESDIVWGHALEGGQSQEMQGVKELLGGWDQGNPWKGKLAWVPGSFLGEGNAVVWAIGSKGYWSATSQ